MPGADSFDDIIMEGFYIDPPEEYYRQLADWRREGTASNLPTVDEVIERSMSLASPLGEGKGRSRGHLGILVSEFILKMSFFCKLEPVAIGGEVLHGYRLRFTAWEAERERPYAFLACVAFDDDGRPMMEVTSSDGGVVDDRTLYLCLYSAMHGELLAAAAQCPDCEDPTT